MFGTHLSSVIFEMLRFDLGGIRRVVVGSGETNYFLSEAM